MKIVTWNAGRGQASVKLPRVMEAFQPDILAVQEIGDLSSGEDHLWTGAAGGKANQGVLLWARPPYRLRKLAVTFRSELYQAAEVHCENRHLFNILNVWVKPLETKGLRGYVESFEAAKEDYAALSAQHPLVMLGDFNYLTEDQAEGLEYYEGLLNCYHDFYEIDKVEYPHFTHRHRTSGSEVHWDYCFLPHFWRSGLTSVEVGPPDTWLKLSDHCPVAVEVQDSVVRRGTPPLASRQEQTTRLPALIERITSATQSSALISWSFEKERAAEVRRLLQELEESGLPTYVNMATREIEIEYPV